MNGTTLKALADDRNFKRYLFMVAFNRLYAAIMDRQRRLKYEKMET